MDFFSFFLFLSSLFLLGRGVGLGMKHFQNMVGLMAYAPEYMLQSTNRIMVGQLVSICGHYRMRVIRCTPPAYNACEAHAGNPLFLNIENSAQGNIFFKVNM